MVLAQANVTELPADTKLRIQIEKEREDFRVATVPDYRALASLIAAAGPSEDF